MQLRLVNLSACPHSCYPLGETSAPPRGARSMLLVALGLMIQASGCSLDSLISHAHNANVALKQHGIEVHHGKIVRVIRF